ncbi:SpoIIE family protein phosphatase [Candidatus Fermentibacterales bacterium]|nr:SpoIIE family protein phosphatase [Candidatus Fermentibacterales bacterium]
MRQSLFVALCVIVSVVVLLNLSWEVGKAWTFANMGDMWSLIWLTEEPEAAFAEVDLQDFPAPPYPAAGDTLIEVAGLPATVDNYFSIFTPRTEPGLEVPIRFRSGGEVFETVIVTRSIPFENGLQILILTALRIPIALALLFIAIYGAVRRPGSIPVRYLSLFCLAIGAQVGGGIALAPSYAMFQLPYFITWSVAFLASAQPAAWLALNLHFPVEHSIVNRRRKLVGTVLLAIPVLHFTADRLFFDSRISPLSAPVSIVLISLGFLVLVRNHHKAGSFLEERQTRLMLLGVTPSMVIGLGLTLCVSIATDWFVSIAFITRMYMFILLFFAYLLVPLCIGQAIRRYRLLELEARLRRGTRFFVVNLLLIGVMLGSIYVIAHFVLDSLGVQSRTPTLVVGLVMALGFVPGQRKLRRALESRFYPEKARLRELLRDFLRTSLATADSGSFWEQLEQKLEDGLGTERILPVLRRPGCDQLMVEGIDQAPFREGDELVSRLRTGGHPMLVDELLASGKVEVTGDQRDWLTSSGSAILLPLRTSSGLEGFLALGRKTSEEDYSAEELELLQSLSSQVALVTENLELLEEKIQKERLDQQLEVARSIQERLLPDHSPRTPGLRVEALIRFCLEVAGDYYDVLTLEDGRTVVAIGDVSGKGVGPALLMANLQASLRTTQEIGVELAESVARINRLVYENTPTDMFITFFVMVFDPVNRTVRYVNAGHDWPMLFHADGRMEQLSTGGMVLGVVGDETYSAGEAAFGDGDTLILYTDGVTEAMDQEEKEFGLGRLAEVVRECSDRPPSELLEEIERRVILFHGGDDLYDDFTIIAIRPEEDR